MAMTLHPGEPEAGPWRRAAISELLELLDVGPTRPGAAPDRPKVIAIDGRGGAGKTSVTSRLQAAVSGSTIVHTDDIAWNHSIFDWADLLADAVLAPARRREPVHFTPPAWTEHGRTGAIDVPADCSVIWLEGTGSARRELREHVDGAIWVQTDRLVSEQRMVDRDGPEKARRELAEWLPHELPFFLDQRPWQTATVVLAGTDVLDHDPRVEVVLAPAVDPMI